MLFPFVSCFMVSLYNAARHSVLFLFSEEQKRIKEQMDAICQGKRPEVTDRPKLTRMEAFIVEILRYLDLGE